MTKKQNHIQISAHEYEAFQRQTILLQATSDILHTVNESQYVVSAMECTSVWDEVTSDGYCLLEEIDQLLSDIENKKTEN